eukprot:NODE_14465_length_1107_cov_9.092857.p5 GENE.NODE_14465_length_1107_cov_9.092857~~NODE_14465_length_1107_cov_9.092857.p5  ORF type:complete len:63 (+),score=40.16 NODE_14465_length_1107_cov_9.092857:814-1002(+)
MGLPLAFWRAWAADAFTVVAALRMLALAIRAKCYTQKKKKKKKKKNYKKKKKKQKKKKEKKE